ncbi:rod shape-determining protein RodA [Acetobacterium sp.]|uniref:rod shape-determining protein RodA n=1 Tax=Acetobacterium sp. TaxID=1872094 RepID=UPI002F42F9C6
MRLKNGCKNLDYGLIISVLILFIIGMISIFTATNVEGLAGTGAEIYIIKQGISFIIGCVIVFFLIRSDYNLFADHWKWIYGISLLVLLIVFIPGVGTTNMGTTGWINLGFFEVQTSEIAKMGFILSFAKILELRYDRLDCAEDLIVPAAFIFPPTILMILQPDFGQALVILVIALGMLFVAGFNIRYFYGLFLFSFIAIPTAWFFALDYQKARILSFFHPEADPLGTGYHAIQSKITIGSGELFGRGLATQGTMTKLDFLPAQWTDFIFSVISETAGFIGAALVILLFVFFMWRLLRGARLAQDMYGTLVIFGVFFMFLFQITENIGMTIGLLPITGITLPFISYGGSSLIINMIAVGFVLNIYRRRLDVRI